MANDHSIELLITANLNVGASIGNINNAIRALSKHPSLKKLDLKIEVDQSFLKSMNNFVNATKKLSSAMEAQNRVVKEEVETWKRLDGTIDKVTKQKLQNGQAVTKTSKVHDESKKKIQQETEALEKQRRSLKQLESDLVGYEKTKTKPNYNKKGEVSSYSNTYKSDTGKSITINTDTSGNVNNYKKVDEQVKAIKLKQQADAQALAYEKQVNAERERIHNATYATQKAVAAKEAQLQAQKVTQEKLHYQALQENGRREQSYAKTVSDNASRITEARTKYANNKTVIDGLNQLQNKMNSVGGSFGERSKTVQGLNAEIKSYQNYAKLLTQLSGKIQAAQTQFKGRATISQELKGLQTSLNSLSGTSAQKIAGITGLGEQFNRITTGAGSASKGISGFGNSMLGSIANAAKMQIALAALYAPLTALRSIISTVMDVDSQMTQLKRVMDVSNDFVQIQKNNLAIANELGRSIQDVNENAIGFARMGFDSAQTENLTKVSTLFQNISDLTPEESINTLTAAMTVYNIESSKSIDIADKLNEVKHLPPHMATYAEKLSLIDLEVLLVG